MKIRLCPCGCNQLFADTTRHQNMTYISPEHRKFSKENNYGKNKSNNGFRIKQQIDKAFREMFNKNKCWDCEEYPDQIYKYGKTGNCTCLESGCFK